MEKKEKLNFNDYVCEVLKTESNDFESISTRVSQKNNIRLLHSTMGIVTELSEIFEALNKPNFDLVNLKEEIGDCFWYIGVAVDELGLDKNKFITESFTKPYFSVFSFFFKRKYLKDLNILANINASTCLDLMKKEIFYGKKPLDKEKLVKCLQAVVSNLFSMSVILEENPERVFFINIQKLHKKRYASGKFSSSEAIDRDLKGERDILSK